MSAAKRMVWVLVAVAGLMAGYGMNSRADSGKPEKGAATFEVYKDHAGEFRWRLRAMNKQVIATSGEGYKEKASCLGGIESVKKHAADAPVEEK